MGNPAWAAEPRYPDLRSMGKYYPAEVDALLLPWLVQHTMAELAALALEHNLIVSPVRALAEVFATERSGELWAPWHRPMPSGHATRATRS